MRYLYWRGSINWFHLLIFTNILTDRGHPREKTDIKMTL